MADGTDCPQGNTQQSRHDHGVDRQIQGYGEMFRDEASYGDALPEHGLAQVTKGNHILDPTAVALIPRVVEAKLVAHHLQGFRVCGLAQARQGHIARHYRHYDENNE